MVSRVRHAEIGHHHIAGAYLLRYAQETSWREDKDRVPVATAQVQFRSILVAATVRLTGPLLLRGSPASFRQRHLFRVVPRGGASG